MEVNNNSADQEWQKLKVHIDRTFGRYLGNSLDLIEYNPKYAVQLLSMSLDNSNDHPGCYES